jgi:uncharacterized damage-inducible protein DinB
VDLLAVLRELARYNTWMNWSICECAATLSDEQRKRDLGAYFRSVHGTLNHLLLTDRVQLGRFIGADRTRSLDADGREIQILSLDQELYADFGRLRREREKTDALIEHWAANEITPAFLAGTLEYRAMSASGDFSVPTWAAVFHFFNHQTHHRGQVTTLLLQLGRDPGVTDLMAMLRRPVA